MRKFTILLTILFLQSSRLINETDTSSFILIAWDEKYDAHLGTHSALLLAWPAWSFINVVGRSAYEHKVNEKIGFVAGVVRAWLASFIS